MELNEREEAREIIRKLAACLNDRANLHAREELALEAAFQFFDRFPIEEPPTLNDLRKSVPPAAPDEDEESEGDRMEALQSCHE